MVSSATNNLWLGVAAGAVAGAIFGVAARLPGPALWRRPDHRRRGDRRLLHGLDQLPDRAGAEPGPKPECGLAVFHRSGSRLLDKIPVLGPALFNQNYFFYGAIVLLVVMHIGLFKTRWGLRLEGRRRAPQGRRNSGYPRASVRYRNVILGGVIAGIGGAWFTIGIGEEFSAEMTAGLGYVALAAMIFGRWRPFGALSAPLSSSASPRLCRATWRC